MTHPRRAIRSKFRTNVLDTRDALSRTPTCRDPSFPSSPRALRLTVLIFWFRAAATQAGRGGQNQPLGVSGYNRSRGGQADRVFGGTPERISRSSFWDRDFWLPGALFYTVPRQEAIRAGVRGAGARAAFSCFFDNFFEVRPSDF